MTNRTESADAVPPQMLRTDHYDFDLPKELIAQHPLPNRIDARLMQVDRAAGAIDHAHIRDLPEILRPGDCLVLNNTKVVPAKLVGIRTQTGGRWQGLFLQADPGGLWKVLCKTRGKAQPGETITMQDRHGVDRWTLTLVTRLDDGGWLVRPDVDGSAEELLEQIGRVPLPHYIRGGHMVDADLDDYQTVFAKHAGAVAAPTAGLHLTNVLLRQLIDRGVKIAQVTLHVGIGTFRPVTADALDDHAMHHEWGSIEAKSVELLNQTREAGGRIIAVGTTSVRVLETAALDLEDGQPLQPWSGDTNLFIKPPWKFKAIDGLLTNFHLPRSTLLVMIRTLGGDALMTEAYEQAVKEQYRFFSYGDAMLIV